MKWNWIPFKCFGKNGINDDHAGEVRSGYVRGDETTILDLTPEVGDASDLQIPELSDYLTFAYVYISIIYF